MADDLIAECFKKGADVEISSNEEGLRGSWFEGTVIRPPPGNKAEASAASSRKRRRGGQMVLVEYKTLMDEEDETRPLREELDVVHLRPPPPRENRSSFAFNDEVDAYYSDGWWEGVITEVRQEEGKYAVFFRGSKEQIDFTASELRLHREWVNGKWEPPLEPQQDEAGEPEKETNEGNISPRQLEPDKGMSKEDISPGQQEPNKDTSKDDISPGQQEPDKDTSNDDISAGQLVEVSTDEEGFEGAWFSATIIEKLDQEKYLIEYQHLRNDDNTDFLREEIDSLHIRPRPPDINLVDRFQVADEVDALYNDAWWVGVISKVLKADKYVVYFKSTDEKLKFKHSDLRVHQEWIGGKWVISSQALKP